MLRQLYDGEQRLLADVDGVYLRAGHLAFVVTDGLQLLRAGVVPAVDERV